MATPLDRKDRKGRRLHVVAIGIVASGFAIAVWMLWDPSGTLQSATGGQPAKAEATIAPEVAAREETLAPAPGRTANPTFAAMPADEGVLVSTFLEGLPWPTVLLRVDSPPQFGLSVDWSSQAPQHSVARADHPVCHALLGRGAVIEILDPRSLPTGPTHRIDLRRARTLQVHLVNVPAGIREHLTILAQVRWDSLPSTYEKQTMAAAYALRSGFPFEMPTDFGEIPLVMDRCGRVNVFVQAKTSPKMFAGREVPFDFDTPRVEVDLSSLAAVATLATVSVTLEFPHAYPSGKMSLVVDGSDGQGIWHEEFERTSELEVVVTLKNLPMTRMGARIQLSRFDFATKSMVRLGDLPIELSPWDVSTADCRVRRVVEAESSLIVTVGGAPRGAKDKVIVLVRGQDGRTYPSQWIDGASQSLPYRIKNLTAGTYFVQAYSQDDAMASPVYEVAIGPVQSTTLAMAVLPAGRVDVGSAEGAPTREVLDLISRADGGVSRFFLNAEGLRRVVCPSGEYDVRWSGGTKRIRVDAGGQHSLVLGR